MPMRSSLPSRPATREDIQPAGQLVDHAQGYREANGQGNGSADARRPSQESRKHDPHQPDTSDSASLEHPRHLSPRPAKNGGDEQAHPGPANPVSDATPTGQICR
jgi:hypothetical protein